MPVYIIQKKLQNCPINPCYSNFEVFFLGKASLVRTEKAAIGFLAGRSEDLTSSIFSAICDYST